MQIVEIQDPADEDIAPILQGVMDYGLSQIQGILPVRRAFHLKVDGKFIGGATAKIHFTKCYLDNLWVDENHRGNGYGACLLEKVAECAANHACNAIYLNTLNDKAVALYQKQGYSVVATVAGYVDGFNLVYMVKNIAHPETITPQLWQ